MKLEKFLWCFELEFGGVIIGFYHLVVYCLAVIAAIVGFILALIYNDEVNLTLVGISCAVVIVVSCIMAYISWQFILGVEFRHNGKVQLFRMICFIGLFINVLLAIVALSQIGNFDVKPYHTTIFVVYLIISFMAQIYIFIVIDSIYKKFRDEHVPTYIITPSTPVISY